MAIKTFENVSAESRQELHREALAMCELRHPYIAHIYGKYRPFLALLYSVHEKTLHHAWPMRLLAAQVSATLP